MVWCRRPVDAPMTPATRGVTSDTMRHLRFLVEEPSMKDFLNGLLPRYLPEDATFDIIAFSGKRDLKKKLLERLYGLKRSLLSGHRLFVVLDRDSEDCHVLKGELEGIAKEAGLITRTSTSDNWQLVNRIVIEELEAWYFGDWEAVRAAYENAPADPSKRPKFRDPDAIKEGTWEAFEKVMRSEFPGGLRKREAARKIGERIDPNRSTSRSFQVFYEAVLEAAARRNGPA